MVWGQHVDDLHMELDSIVISESPLRLAPIGAPVQSWETSRIGGLQLSNIADLLDHEAGVFIKSNGPGLLATSAVRGAGAGHLLVLWNGLPIHSPMLGTLDLSLLPFGVSNTITFQKGGGSTMWGSGAIGGVLMMRHKVRFDHKNRLAYSQNFGQFGQLSQSLHWRIGTEKWEWVTQVFHHSSENNFRYEIAQHLPKKTQKHAQLFQQNITQDLSRRIGRQGIVSLHYWYQKSRRQLPPTNVQTRSEAVQQDLAHRLAICGEWGSSAFYYKVNLGYFDEKIKYDDPLSSLHTDNSFRSVIGDLSVRAQPWKHSQFLLGSTVSYTDARSQGYRDLTPSEMMYALFGSFNWDWRHWKVQASLRQALLDDKLLPITPTVAISYHFSELGNAYFKWDRNYRNPTLNDRYWMPGGHVDLLVESGWGYEAGLQYRVQMGDLEAECSASVYSRIIDNWIMWSLRPGDAFWSANNLAKVWSRGVEPRMKVNGFFGEMAWSLNVSYEWIKSTNEISIQNPQINAGDQLFYVPMHQGSIGLDLNWRFLEFSYVHRFIDAYSGVNEAIPSYQLGDLSLACTPIQELYDGQLFIKINNIWNESYAIVERRPMPGLNVQFGFSFYINH